MSYYTVLFPPVDRFPRDKFADTKEVEKEAEAYKNFADEAWTLISGMVFMSPQVGSNIQKTLSDLKNSFDDVWNRYLAACDQEYYYYRVLELWNDELWHQEYIEKYNLTSGWPANMSLEEAEKCMDKTLEEYKAERQKERDEWRPSLSVNHFEYNSDPEEGVTECEKNIAKIKRRLFSMVVANPKDITPDKDDEDTRQEPLWYLRSELEDVKEFLDDTIWDLNFSKLCVEFWDTHEEG